MKRLILIDGNSLMYRAFFGLAQNKNFKNSQGLFTNAVFAFARMINNLVENNNYEAMCVAFDAGKETFRHHIMDGYKDGRSPMPDEMRSQIPLIKEYLDLKRIKRYELKLYEADDIIGTLAKQAEDQGYLVDIYSSDKDLLQLVSDKTTVNLTKKGITDLETYTPKSFYEHYGILVSSFIDLKALMGDKSDNILGVPGIGEKKALKYLTLYKDLDGIFSHLNEIKGADLEKLTTYKDQAYLCKKMATILRDAPLEITLADTAKQEEDYDNLIKFYEKLEFHSFIKEKHMNKVEDLNYFIVNNIEQLKPILTANNYLFIENSNYNYHKSPILALVIINKDNIYIINNNLLKEELLKVYLEDENIKKYVYDYKRMYVSLRHFNINLKGIYFDLYLGTYLLNPKVTKGDFKVLASYYNFSNIEYEEEIYGKGVKRAIPDINILYPYLARKANIILNATSICHDNLINTNQYDLLTQIEIPLSYVLGKAEFEGVRIDLDELDRQDEEIAAKIKELENEIYDLARREFNINSPKQLATILFEELKIQYPGNSKKGYSTDISILEQLREYKIVELVIDYRKYTKLYSSYIKGLSEQIFPDNKVHTIFEQALTETGRLSSIEPNLQNIPIKTEQGAKIRKLFIPSFKNNKFYSADYSQIELRVLASVADVKNFKEAFNNNIDVHAQTARTLFSKEDITSLERRKAKAVNFGIVYGISPYGLAKDLDVTQKEAKAFIERYKEINPEIVAYSEKMIEEAKTLGYVSTIKNRRRYISEINSSNFLEREFGKRIAVNAPIQGSAADIIKIAMINIDKEIEERKLKSKLLIQVHDELLFEVYPQEVEIIKDLVANKMTEAVDIGVKLEIASGFGDNWFELK